MNKRYWLFLVAASAFTLSGASFAGPKPSPQEVDKVLDYYENGYQLGPILVEAKLCNKIGTENESKNNCEDAPGNNMIVKGESKFIWMKLIIPKGVNSDKIVVQFKHRDVTRKVRELKVTSAYRYRTWTKFAFKRTGDWKAEVMYDNGDQVSKLTEIPFTITADMPVQTETTSMKATP